MKLHEIKTPTLIMFEAAYEGNIGAMEMFKFFQVADERQKKLMQKIVAKNDFKSFKRLIKIVLGVELM